MAFTVIRTDLMSGTDVGADLVSLRFYDETDEPAQVENGTIVKLSELEGREVWKAEAAEAGDDLSECAIVATPELMYDERKRNLDEFINEAGKPARGYRPRSRNIFSITKEGFVGGTPPAKGAEVGIGADGKLDAAGTGFGTCIEIEATKRYTYYAIQIAKVEV